VSDPDNEIDAWIARKVEPLAPQPGTFQRIRTRARRRRTMQVLASMAAVVIVIVGSFAVPKISKQLSDLPGSRHPGPSVRSSTPSASTRLSPTATSSSEHSEAPSISGALPVTGPGHPVPINFQPSSVTFISTQVGAVIGQAGIPGHCGPPNPYDCTSVADTANYGMTWYGIPAPVTGAPDGSTGVGQLRFLNQHDGWAFGPALYTTHDGGATWTSENTYGLRVTDLETTGDDAFAIFAQCSGGGARYGAHCTRFSLYFSTSNGNDWNPVPGAQASVAGDAGAAVLVLTGGGYSGAGHGYVIMPNGMMLSGPLTGQAWATTGRIPHQCTLGPPTLFGQPTDAQLAVSTGKLFLACNEKLASSNGSPAITIYASSNGGGNWTLLSNTPVGTGAIRSLAAIGNLLVLGSTAGIEISNDDGAHWTQPEGSPPGAPLNEPGFTYVGMTDALHGVAVPADLSLGEIYTTTDGGNTWLPSRIQGT
jgi:hypothetical protein